MKKILLLFTIVLSLLCSPNKVNQSKVIVGLDSIEEYVYLFKNKSIGIITNHTAQNSQNKHILDIFLKLKNVNVKAMFIPEHGIRGSIEQGIAVNSSQDEKYDIPVFSLYGKTYKPTSDMLKDVDMLVFDIQDVGTRFYTYIYTMSLSMEAAGEQGIPFVILDRPNPINGVTVEGNILEPEFTSFIGLYPLPVRHGMTVGELAMMINNEGWLANQVKVELKIIPMQNWRRKLWYDQTGLTFIKTSPNMQNLETAIVYPGTCLLEGTNVSEGRGTDTPFLIFGAPWIDGQGFAKELYALDLPGVAFEDTNFIPISVSGVASTPKYVNKQCSGVQVCVSNRDQYQAYLTGIHIVKLLSQMYSDSLIWREEHFNRLCGSAKILKTIVNHSDIDSLIFSWQDGLAHFLNIREKYLIYD